MATKRLQILGWATKPDASGDVFIEPASIKGTNDFFDGMVLVFNDSGADDEAFLRFEVPQGYVDSAALVIVWTTTAITGSVEFGVAYRAVGGNDVESLDQATAQESLLSGNDDVAPSAANERMEYSISLTDGNFAAGDTVQMILSREGLDAGDTLAAAVRIYGLAFEYADAA
jgi:hypothetical protein